MTAPPIERLRPLAGGGENASVELVRIGEALFVLKRQPPGRAALERRFQAALAEAGLPSLTVTDHPDLGPGELLLEYIDGSPILGRSLTLARCADLGAAVAGMHRVRTPAPMRTNRAGDVVATSWVDFVDGLIARGLEAQRVRASDLGPALLAKAEATLGALRDAKPTVFALTHGDLHLANAMLRGEEVVLFDKAGGVWSAPPAFDLALIHSEGFPGARYGADRPDDPARLAGFLRGYGGLTADDAAWLDHFALAHCLLRYPSPFVPELRQILEAALELAAAR